MNEQYYLTVFISGAIIFVLFVFFIVFYMLYHKRRLHLHYIEKEKMVYEHNMTLLTARLDEQERTMSQISRELHDNVAQKMDFLQMNIKALAETDSATEHPLAFDNSITLGEQIGNDIRNLSYSLNSDYVTRLGLVAVVEKELSYIKASRQIDCQINVSGDRSAFSGEKELLVYRIIQEALHNTVKHARAAKIIVDLQYSPNEFCIRIIDDGVGFDQADHSFQPGLGFKNIQHRVNLLKGAMYIKSARGMGSTIAVTLNLLLR